MGLAVRSPDDLSNNRLERTVAKLDRLARNVAFISQLMDSGVEFVACDFPQANRLTVHILAAVAEYEHRLISERTKAAQVLREFMRIPRAVLMPSASRAWRD